MDSQALPHASPPPPPPSSPSPMSPLNLRTSDWSPIVPPKSLPSPPPSSPACSSQEHQLSRSLSPTKITESFRRHLATSSAVGDAPGYVDLAAWKAIRTLKNFQDRTTCYCCPTSAQERSISASRTLKLDKREAEEKSSKVQEIDLCQIQKLSNMLNSIFIPKLESGEDADSLSHRFDSLSIGKSQASGCSGLNGRRRVTHTPLDQIIRKLSLDECRTAATKAECRSRLSAPYYSSFAHQWRSRPNTLMYRYLSAPNVMEGPHSPMSVVSTRGGAPRLPVLDSPPGWTVEDLHRVKDWMESQGTIASLLAANQRPGTVPSLRSVILDKHMSDRSLLLPGRGLTPARNSSPAIVDASLEEEEDPELVM
ncbi:unnamed protein product [Cyprideis torosa]|uniref:Uncharacterized protein n=1 Tax=Cyprideis torosa TaxID=163714 RepID=A0A7R8ZIK8_9CRUS|nr:unnamed protein product [Cyprideis torosa]CAG0886370.1 unnamed protein product [Cyprideis torosa]